MNIFVSAIQSADLLEKIAELTDDEWSKDALVWHKSCHGDFSTKTTLERLRQKFNSDATKAEGSALQQGQESLQQSRSSSMMNWELCLFCQNPAKTDGVRNVST